MRILLTGSVGFIGRHLQPFLARRGHEVVALRRGQDGAPAHLSDLEGWRGWPEGVEAVVHLAALNPARGSGAARDDAGLMAANTHGTRALASRAAREGAGVVVFASTALVHGLGPAPVAEDERIAPQNSYAGSKLGAETELARALAGTGTRGVALRLPPVFGPGGRGAVALVRRLADLPFPPPVPEGGRRSLLWLGDALHAFALALERDVPSGAYLVAGDGATGLRVMVEAVRGRPVPRLPDAPLRLTARLAGRGAAWERLAGSLVLRDDRFRASSGWRPEVPTLEALGWDEDRMRSELEALGDRP